MTSKFLLAEVSLTQVRRPGRRDVTRRRRCAHQTSESTAHHDTNPDLDHTALGALVGVRSSINSATVVGMTETARWFGVKRPELSICYGSDDHTLRYVVAGT